MDQPLCLRVDVPICAFRPFESREYQDTHPLPPPSAVYGMLLSFVGVRREDKARHRGVSLTLAAEAVPERSRVFRKFRRGKELGDLRPDYQDLLIGLRLWVWIADGHDRAAPTLPARMAEALATPAAVSRFGGLSLGESSYLVDSINAGLTPPSKLTFLVPRLNGFYDLPTWIDHLDARQSVRRRFDVESIPTTDGAATCGVIVGEQ